MDRKSSHNDNKIEQTVIPDLPIQPQHGQEELEAREIEEKKTHLVFKYLKEKKPLPSKIRARWIVVALYMIMTLSGWEAGAVAPLLPFLQRYYDISYLVMSIIFITGFVGGVISAGLNVYLTDRLGFGLVTSIGTACFALGYAIASSGGPYPLFALSFVLNGMGFGFQDAQINTLTARLPNPNSKMALLHSFFGLGGTVAPFISTPFVQAFPNRPYLLYTINLGVALLTLAIEVIVFRGQTEEQLTGRPEVSEKPQVNPSEAIAMPMGEMSAVEAHISERAEGGEERVALAEDTHGATREETQEGVERRVEEQSAETSRPLMSSGAKMRVILTNPYVYVFVFYSFLYVGLETTIAAWAPTYLIEVRGADSNAGYVTSGFWGGLTIGRVILIPVTSRLGNRLSVLVYSIIALGLQLVAWLVDNYISSAVCICLIGFFLAPIFPAAIVLITEIIPEELHVGVIGLFGTIGGAGAAATPFILGAIADRYGFWVMGPYMTATVAASILLWLLVPRHSKTLS